MSNAVTGSAALIDLKNDLTQLSKSLLVIYDLMNEDMHKVGEAWQDSKYQEFMQGYQPQIKKCEEIANRYTDWCARVLEPTIQNVLAVERTDVSGGAVSGGSVGGAVIGGTAVAAGAGSVAASTGMADTSGFNMGNDQTPSSKVASDIDTFLNKPSTSAKQPFSAADQACVDRFGPGYHGVPSSESDAHVHFGGTTGGNKVTSGLEVDLGILKGKLGSEANGGSETLEGWAQCVKD